MRAYAPGGRANESVAATHVAGRARRQAVSLVGDRSLGYSHEMPARLDDEASSIQRWRAGLTGSELLEPENDTARAYVPANGRLGAQHGERAEDVERYDEDYDYYWGDFRLPLWIALIWQVPWRQRLDIFVIGFIIGLIVAGVAVLWGLLLSQY